MYFQTKTFRERISHNCRVWGRLVYQLGTKDTNEGFLREPSFSPVSWNIKSLINQRVRSNRVRSVVDVVFPFRSYNTTNYNKVGGGEEQQEQEDNNNNRSNMFNPLSLCQFTRLVLMLRFISSYGIWIQKTDIYDMLGVVVYYLSVSCDRVHPPVEHKSETG